MGPLSAVAVAFAFVMTGFTWLTWITASTHTLGVIYCICAIALLVDAFWLGSGPRWHSWRERHPVVVNRPPGP